MRAADDNFNASAHPNHLAAKRFSGRHPWPKIATSKGESRLRGAVRLAFLCALSLASAAAQPAGDQAVRINLPPPQHWDSRMLNDRPALWLIQDTVNNDLFAARCASDQLSDLGVACWMAGSPFIRNVGCGNGPADAIAQARTRCEDKQQHSWPVMGSVPVSGP